MAKNILMTDPHIVDSARVIFSGTPPEIIEANVHEFWARD